MRASPERDLLEDPEPTFFFNPVALVVVLIVVLLVTWTLIWAPVP